MRGNTFVMLIIALVFGAVAVFFANIWLNNQTARPTAVIVAPAQVETSTIVVASRNISFGEAIIPDALIEIPWPKSAIPEGSYAKIADLTTDGVHLVLNPISPNEPILKWKISGAGARASLSALVGPGMRAASIRTNDVVGVAGFILPGDRADILYTRNANGDNSSSIDILIQNVRILAVDQVADQKKSEPVLAKVITVEVKPIDAQKIALAQTTGSVSFTLRAAGGVEPAPAQRIVEQELVSSTSIYQTAIDAQTAAQAAIAARLNGLEGSITNVAKKVDETNSSKAQLAAKLASLETAVKNAADATGKDEQALRAKLAALEAAIHDASNSTAGDDAMRAKLAEFEANLRALAAGSKQPIIITAAAMPVEVPTKVSVGITRGTKRDIYEVPIDAAN